MGPDSYWLLHGADMDAGWLLETTFTSSANALALPILAALPGAAQARKEISSGAVRGILFRCGMPSYILIRVMNLLLVTVIAQGLGLALFLAVVVLCAETVTISLISFVIARLLTTMVFAILGSLGALVTRDTICAYAVPVAIGYAANMLRTRFWVSAEWLDSLCWLTGSGPMLRVIGVVLLIAIVGYAVILRREVKRHV